KVTVFQENSGRATALRAGADGRLYAAQPARKRIVSYAISGGGEKVSADNVEAADLAVTAKGAIYFTDSMHTMVGLAANSSPRVGMAVPAGLALSGDQAMLLATDAQARFSWSFQLAPDGSLRNGEPFYRLELPESGWLSGVTSVAQDSLGQVYFATASGIQ